MPSPAFCFGAVLVAALALPLSATAEEADFFTSNRAQKGLERIFDKAGHPTRVLGVDIRSNQLIVELQDPANPGHVDAYIDRFATGMIDRWLWPESVSGPRPVELNLPNPDLEANLFALKPDDLAIVAKLAAAAVKRAGLEDAAVVDRMELRRQLFLLPRPTSGTPEWSAEVTSGRERATVYASIDGDITHANLKGTRRAQMLNYLAGGKELDAEVTLAKDVIGAGPILKSVLVYSRSLTIVAALPDSPGRFGHYEADIDGVYRDTDLDVGANISLPGQRPPGRFAFADVDWTLLPKLQPAARERLQLPDGVISHIEISRPGSAVGEPMIAWEIYVESPADSTLSGGVVFDNKGAVLSTRYPRGRAPKLDLLQAASYPAAFHAVSKALGEHAPVVELMFRSDSLMITTKDPQKPDNLTVLEYGGDSVARSIMPPLNWPTFGPDWFFDLSQAQPAAAQWTALQQDTLGRLGLADGHIERITISKQKLFMPRNDRVLIEVRAEAGKREGRVVYDLNGKMVDIVKP